jgi:hypothetical protein
MSFDGRLFWYDDWFDPSDDRCCAADCRTAIDEDDVPLILFRGEGKDMQQTRLHTACAERLGLFRQMKRAE